MIEIDEDRIEKLASLLEISSKQAQRLIQFLDLVRHSGFGFVAINVKKHESYNVTMQIDGPPDDKE